MADLGWIVGHLTSSSINRQICRTTDWLTERLTDLLLASLTGRHKVNLTGFMHVCMAQGGRKAVISSWKTRTKQTMPYGAYKFLIAAGCLPRCRMITSSDNALVFKTHAGKSPVAMATRAVVCPSISRRRDRLCGLLSTDLIFVIKHFALLPTFSWL